MNFFFMYNFVHFIARPASGMNFSKIDFNSPSSYLDNSPVLKEYIF